MQPHILEYLDRTLQRNAGRTALVDGERSLTFDELARRIAALAEAIRSRTDARNSPIAVYLPKSADAVISLWATLATGNAYAPLDVRSPAARTLRILEKLEPALLITDEAGRSSLRDAGLDDSRVLVVGESPSDAPIPSTFVPAGAVDVDPAYVIHTSGSTGTPKGVTIPHRGVIDYIDWAVETFAIDAEERIGNQAPLFFDNSTLDLYLCLATGAALHLLPESLFAYPLRLLEHLRANDITTIFWVPSVLINTANLGVLDSVPLPKLRKVLFAGEVMPNRQLNAWRRALPHALFANLYGPTEITVDCTYFIVEREFADDEPLPIGIPCRNSDVLVLDDHNHAADIGELCVRGSSLALGYWNEPEKTAAAFVQNPLNPHYPDLIYRTGDLVQRNDRGELLFLGRRDSQIKHLGYRIELGDIEVAAAGLPELNAVCVIYDVSRQEICLAYEAAAPLGAGALRQQLSRTIPKYMLPTKFLHYEKLPMNANGKIDRQLLAKELT